MSSAACELGSLTSATCALRLCILVLCLDVLLTAVELMPEAFFNALRYCGFKCQWHEARPRHHGAIGSFRHLFRSWRQRSQHRMQRWSTSEPESQMPKSSQDKSQTTRLGSRANLRKASIKRYPHSPNVVYHQNKPLCRCRHSSLLHLDVWTTSCLHCTRKKGFGSNICSGAAVQLVIKSSALTLHPAVGITLCRGYKASLTSRCGIGLEDPLL